DPAEGPLLRYEISPNLKTIGPKFGERVKEIRTALAALDPNSLVAKLQVGGKIGLDCAGTTVILDENDVLLRTKAPDGWAGLSDPLDGNAHATSVKVDGHPLTIQLRKVTTAI